MPAIYAAARKMKRPLRGPIVRQNLENQRPMFSIIGSICVGDKTSCGGTVVTRLIGAQAKARENVRGASMKRLHAAAMVAALAAAFLLGSASHHLGVFQMSGTRYIKTTEPLLLASEGDAQYFHMLPTSTALYTDQSYPEGHKRYIVYVNFKGALPADVVESDKHKLIDPIWARTVEKEDLQALLAQTPVSKDDLVRILKASKITREELAQIVRDWRE